MTPEEVRYFTKKSDLQGFLALATTWGLVFLCFAWVAWTPNFFSVLISVILIGGRQLALAILMHEASHETLFATRSLNRFFGRWFCSYPIWNDVDRYRKHHQRHHTFTGTDRDPDMGLVTPFPSGWGSFLRKILRDISGVTGLKRVYGLILMDLGFISYTISTGAKRIPQKGRSTEHVVQTGFKNLRGVLLTNLVLFGSLWALGYPELYLLWVVSYLTTFSLFLRIRSIAEHACTEKTPDQTKNTRTTMASPLARLTVAPHYVNYHLEHHLLISVPYFRLPEFHRWINERGGLKHSPVAKNYWEVISLAAKSRQN